MKSKKSQTEIMGLAIVVILLIIGMTFVIRFMINQEPVDYKKQFTQAELASNMINTFVHTTSDDCSDLSMTELLQDCAQNPTSPSISCSGNTVNSCDYAKNTADFIFTKTFKEWKYDYEFKIFLTDENSIFTLGSPCPKDIESETFPIPISSGTLFVRLDLCS